MPKEILYEQIDHGKVIEVIFTYGAGTGLYKAAIKQNVLAGSVWKWSEQAGWCHLVGTSQFTEDMSIDWLIDLADKFHQRLA